jgi:cytosine/uracil/thiamine/allantoin permease
MSTRRVVLVVTFLVVAGLGVWFAVAQWDQANRVATVASALGAVAAVGVAVWAALRGSGADEAGSLRVSRSGTAIAGRGGTANTGVRASASTLRGPVGVNRSGDADASGGGDANSGIRLD